MPDAAVPRSSLLRSNRALQALAIAAAIAIGAVVPFGGILTAAIPLAAIGGIVLLAFPSSVLWMMLGLLFFGNRTEYSQLVLLARWLPTVGIALLPIAILLHARPGSSLRFWTREDFAQIRPFITLFSATTAALAVVILVSSLVNGTSVRDIVVGSLLYLRYPFFFLCLLWANFSAEMYRRLLRVFVAFTLLQVPITAIQYFVFGMRSDSLSGTLGSNDPLAMVVLATVTLLTARIITYGYDTRTAVAIALLFPQLVFGDIQAAVFMFPIIIGYLLLRHGGKIAGQSLLSGTGKRVVQGTLGAAIGGAIALAIISPDAYVGLASLAQIPDLLGQEHIGTTSIGRLTVLPFMVNQMKDVPVQFLLGFGPESMYGGLLGGDAGRACQFFFERGLNSCRTTQIFRTFGEFGLIGLALTAFLAIQVWLLAWFGIPKHMSRTGKAITLSADGVAFIFVLFLPFYLDSWRNDVYAFVFWLWAAAMIAERLKSTATANA